MRWQGDANVSVLMGRAIRLKLEMWSAKLYASPFVGALGQWWGAGDQIQRVRWDADSAG